MAGVIGLALMAGSAEGQDGRTVFEAHCASCHATSTGAPPGPGPNLAGLAGRRVAGDAAFDYSPALRQAEGHWSAERLALFLQDPEDMLPGLWMGGNGVQDATARRLIVEYLMGQ
jgi:cytochrome c